VYSFYVYILASKKDGVLYTGVTNCLVKRIYEHKHNLNDGFSKMYFVKRLVYFEEYKYINEAIAREKCIKRWKRDWKIRLIEDDNPEWKDLYSDIGGDAYEISMKNFNKKSKTRFLPSQE